MNANEVRPAAGLRAYSRRMFRLLPWGFQAGFIRRGPWIARFESSVWTRYVNAGADLEAIVDRLIVY